MKNNVDQNKVNNNTYTGTLITSWVLYGVGIFFTVFIFASFGIGLAMANKATDDHTKNSFKAVWVASLVTLIVEVILGLILGLGGY